MKHNLLPNQRKFKESSVKYRAYIGGIGSGKTWIGCLETIRFCFRNPGALFVILAPTYKMLNDATQRTFFELCPKELIKSYNRSDNVLKLINGTEILFRSCETGADVDRLRGPNLAGFWIDEAPLVPGKAWKILIGRLRQTGKELKAWITGTPYGFNWVYKEFVKKGSKEYILINVSTYQNTYLPQEYIRDLEENYTGAFKKQELEGQFVAHSGIVYMNFSRFKHVLKEEDIKKIKFKECISGVDFGFSNPSVSLFIGIDGDGRIYIFDEIYEKRLLTETFIDVIKEKLKVANVNMERFYCDPSEPSFIQQFNNADLNATGAENEIMAGINRVSTYLEIKEDGKPRLYISEKCFNTIMEFETYRYPEQKEDKEERDKPLKAFDHAMDALRYAIHSMDKGKAGVLTGGEDIFG